MSAGSGWRRAPQTKSARITPKLNDPHAQEGFQVGVEGLRAVHERACEDEILERVANVGVEGDAPGEGIDDAAEREGGAGAQPAAAPPRGVVLRRARCEGDAGEHGGAEVGAQRDGEPEDEDPRRARAGAKRPPGAAA